MSLPRKPKTRLRDTKLAIAMHRPLEPLNTLLVGKDTHSEANPLSLEPRPAMRIILGPLKFDWVDVGESLLHQFLIERDVFVKTAPSCGVFLGVVEPPPPPSATETHATSPTLPQSNGVEASNATSTQVTVPISETPALAPSTNNQKDQQTMTLEGHKDDESSKDAPESKDGASRKRSHDSAGLADSNEGVRVRSKRIRARDSVADGPNAPEDATADSWKHLEQHLEPYIQADDVLFETLANLLRKIGIEDVPSAQKLRDLTYLERDSSLPPDSAASDSDRNTNIAVSDFQAVVRSRTNNLARMLLAAGDVVDELGSNSPQAGLAAILGHAKRSTIKTSSKTLLVGGEGLSSFSQEINTKWSHIQEAALTWVQYFLKPGCFPGLDIETTSYTTHLWPDSLKALVVRMIVNLDDFIFASTLGTFEQKSRPGDPNVDSECRSLAEMVQTLFELHLDVYSLIKHPGSGVDQSTQTLQKERLSRWSDLAQCTIEQVINRHGQVADRHPLMLRHLWATAFHLSVCDDVTQDHVVLCLEDLKKTLQDCGNPIIDLQNNAIMPEISVQAIEREISRLTTKDFFIKIFDPYQSDPVTVIESLEPVLEASLSGRALTALAKNGEVDELRLMNGQNEVQGSKAPISKINESLVFEELFKFLESGAISVRLSLWQRLREAYEAIDYPSKIMSCYLRSIECLVQEFGTSSYRESAQEQRHFTLMRMLRILDELCARVLLIADGNRDAFDCVDIDHIQSSFRALVFFAGLLHTFTMYHDALKTGQIQPPQGENGAPSVVPMLASRIQDMQIRLWKLQYILFSEGLAQSPNPSLTPLEDKFDFLKCLHGATGIRGFCKGSNRALLRLLKKEMLHMREVHDFEHEFAQVLFDLYGLDVFPDHFLKQDHGCTPEALDRKTALALLDFILTQASRINIKDLPKTELKNAIEKIHGSLPKIKPSEAMNRNRAIYRAKMKMPIQPLELFQCLDGVGGLPTVPVSPTEAPAASKGWYFLMGQIALTRFRSQKRVGAVPTEDVMLAIAFFVQDIENSAEKWETWYRLAQAYDVQVEENVSWSAEGLNNNSQDIIQQQRSAIHCYTLAVALAIQSADFSFETSSKMADLYSDFGTRIYASSREPFSMAAFSVDEFERTYSGEVLYKKSPFQALQPYTAWRLASVLFRRAIVGKPENWSNYYMLGKCLWKMHCADGARPKAPTVNDVLDAFTRAIKALPERRDSRQYPILEPHYKLVSIVHKLAERSQFEISAAVHMLREVTPYAQGVPAPEERQIWSPYILQVLKNMRVADKSNWHHRMTARAATIIYDNGVDEASVNAAKQELMQQIFTKTMTVQVWKPENERPGRHFVYTTRYSSFFVRLLVQSDDRANLEALAKRLRRKSNDFLNHTKLWQEMCNSYLQLLRQAGNVPDGHEDAVFKSVGQDRFQKRSSLVEAWCAQPSTSSTLLDVLHEALELKRLNNSLMKSTLIDDLISDAYALLYDTVGQDLEAAAPPPPPPPAVEPPAPPPKEREGVMSLSNMMNLDGAAETPTNTPPPLSGPTAAEQVAKPRVRTVSRREIRQAAEAATQKSAAAPAAPPPPKPVPAVEPPRPQQAVVAVEAKPEGSREKVESSAPGSVHDSADDESELSELVEEEDDEVDGEEIIVRPLFPGLANKEAQQQQNGERTSSTKDGG